MSGSDGCSIDCGSLRTANDDCTADELTTCLYALRIGLDSQTCGSGGNESCKDFCCPLNQTALIAFGIAGAVLLILCIVCCYCCCCRKKTEVVVVQNGAPGSPQQIQQGVPLQAAPPEEQKTTV